MITNDKLTEQTAPADAESRPRRGLSALMPAKRGGKDPQDGPEKGAGKKRWRAAVAVMLALVLAIGGSFASAYAGSYWYVNQTGDYIAHTYNNGTKSKSKDFRINGVPAICIEHSKGSADLWDAVSLKTVNCTDTAMRKVLYYGTNGPATDAICCIPMTSIAASQANYNMGGTDQSKNNSKNGRSLLSSLSDKSNPPSWFRVRLWNNESASSRQDLATYACETLVYYYPNGGSAKSGYSLGGNGASSTTSSVWSDGIKGRNSDGTPDTLNLSSVDLYNVTTLFERAGYHVASDSRAWRIGSSSATKYMSQSAADMTGYVSRSRQTIVNLYANWVPNTYYVSYNANGGEGSMDRSTFTYDVSGNLRANDDLITRTGYSFAGWNTKPDGTGTAYADKASVRNLTATDGGTVTLYAQWVKNDYCYIDGVSGSDSRDGMTPETAVKTFKQAYTNVKATGGTIYVVNSVPVKKNMTLSSTYYQEASGKVTIASGESVKIKRYSQPVGADDLEGFDVASNTNALISVDAGTLTLDSVSIDGHDDAVTTGHPIEVAPGVTSYGALVIVQEGGSLAVKQGSVLSDNTNAQDGAKTTSKGWVSTAGAIQNNGTLTMTGGTVSGNSVTSKGEHGAGAGIFNLGSATISGGTVSGNSAAYAGGGVANGDHDTPATLVVSGGTFEGNSAGTAGGAVWNAEGSTTTISAGGFEDNSAGEQGGAVYNGGAMHVTGGDVTGNSAVGGGGVANWGSMTISAGAVSDNSASSQGGGVYNASELTITGGEVSGNSATYGGGFVNRGSASIAAGTMNGNSATYGGGVYNASELSLTGGAVSGNSAKKAGAGVYQGGALAMSANASIDLGNDVYLAAGCHVDVPAELSSVEAVAMLTPSDYTLGRTVARMGYAESLGSTISESFELTPNEPYTLRPGDFLDAEAAVADSDVVVSRTYTVTYDGNENADLNAMQHKYWHEVLWLLSDIPEFTGYYFDNWNMARDGSGRAYAPGDVFTDNADTVLYAQWIPGSYFVAYDANGGQGEQMQTTEHDYGAEFALAENAYYKTGYHFTTWNTAPDGSGDAYEDRQTVSNLTPVDGATVTMFAQWEANPYTVAYNGNGADGGDTPDVAHRYDEMGAVSENGFTRTGYAFSHWNTEQDGSGMSYDAGDEIWNWTDVEGGKIVLYAQWTPIEYDIEFVENGVESEMTGSMDPIHCTYDVESVLPEVGFARTGHEFVSWNTEPDGSGNTFDDAQTVKNLTATDGAVVKLYAQWEALPYVLDVSGLLDGERHDGLGGYGTFDVYIDGLLVAVDVNDWCEEVIYGTPYEITGIEANECYEYLGVVEGSLAGTIPAERTDVVLSFKAPAYTVRYDANGGTGTMEDSQHRYGIWKELSPNAYEMEGFEFVSWNTEPDGLGTQYSDRESVLNLSSDDGAVVTLYAQWGLNSYTVRYDGNGADAGATPDSKHVIGVARTLTKNGFTKIGYTFAGWNTKPDGTGTMDDLEVEGGPTEAYAIYSADDDGLYFVRSSKAPTQGEPSDLIGGRTATTVYPAIETTDYYYNSDDDFLYPEWYNDGTYAKVERVSVKDEIAPVSMNSWFAGMDKLTTVNLSNVDASDTRDLAFLFWECDNLANVVLPDGFGQSAESIHKAFYGCNSLDFLSLPEGFGASVRVASSVFEDCHALETLILPEGFCQAAKDISSAFASCSSLAELGLPAGFGQEAEDAWTVFSNCTSLVKLILPEGFCAKADNLVGAFYNCANLKELKVPAGFGQNATDIWYIFENCSSLEKLVLPDGFASKATRIRTAFSGCSSLTELTLPTDFGGASQTNAGYVFYNCTSLEKVNLAGVNTKACSDLTYMFYGMESLAEVTLGENFSFKGDGTYPTALPSGNWKNVETGITYTADQLKSSYDGETMAGTYVRDTSYAAYYSDGTMTIGRGVVPEAFEGSSLVRSYENIASTDYYYVTGQSSYLLPEWYNDGTVSSIERVIVVDEGVAPVSMCSWFEDAVNCTSIDLSKLDGSKAKNINWVVGDCSNLEELILPDNFGASATVMRGAFKFLDKLEVLDLPSCFGSAGVKESYQLFYKSPCIEKLNLSGMDLLGGEVTDQMFTNMGALVEVELGERFSFKGEMTLTSTHPEYSMLPSADWQHVETGNVYTAADLRDQYDGETMAGTYKRPMLIYAAFFDNEEGISDDWMITLVLSSDPDVEYRDVYGPDGTKLSCMNVWAGIEPTQATSSSDIPWFDASWEYVQVIDKLSPENTAYWFAGMENCKSMDLALLDMSDVTNATSMFAGCSNLTTIHASELWDVSNLDASSNMFANCEKLEGDIAFDSSYPTDKTYAKTSGGYLTYKEAPGSGEGTSTAYSMRSGAGAAGNSATPAANDAMASGTAASALLGEGLADAGEVSEGAVGAVAFSLSRQIASPSDGAIVIFQDQEEVLDLTTFPGATVTLYAQWDPISYVVHYDANGGVGETPDSEHVYDVRSTLTANGFTRDGYMFSGWNTEADGSGDAYLDRNQVLNLTSEAGGKVTLYAQWEPISYNIVYDGNGTTRGTTANSTHLYGVEKALNPNGFYRDGHAFSHWSTEADGSGTSYQDMQTVKDLSSANGATVTLYAQWIPLSYTLDVNGILDGIPSLNVAGYGSFDVYIDGELVADDVAEYRVKHPYGTPYEIADIRDLEGKVFVQVASGDLEGTVSNTAAPEE